MEFRVLGPLEIHAHGRPVPLAGARQRRLLALLLLNTDRAVPLRTLVDALWDEHPPTTAKRQIQNSVSALRRLLGDPTGGPGRDRGAGPGPATILAGNNAYELRLVAATLDATVFRERIDRARELRLAGRDEQAAVELRDALGLWRGPALAGLTGHVVEATAARLDEQRRAATEEWIDLGLGLGWHTELVGDLAELVAMNPLQERLTGQLMLALHRSGRRPDALAAYRRFRDQLADELGLDPGARLQRLHTDILNDEAGPPTDDGGSPAPTRPAPVAGTPAPVLPAQLPADIVAFSGRSAGLAELDRLLDASLSGAGLSGAGLSGAGLSGAGLSGATDPADPRGAATICVIAGTAGVGKTALAIHWSHRVRQHFPDGQLYLNLRGFDPAGPPVDPVDALRHFLDALGVPPARIPVDLPARSALFRSLVANRRMLVVLDNARDPAQVRGLLPGSRTCLVVITSRSLLPGLVAAEGAHPVVLDLLTPAEAAEMLAGRLGRDRLAADPQAVEEIITRCARLPLAIAVAAARAATHAGFPLATIAGELRAARGALDPFAGADPVTDVRTVFSWSYQELSAPAKRLFRLLGLHPGPDVTAPAAASLTGLPGQQARSAVTELAEANLVDEHHPGRYTLHDLLRAYAAELVEITESPDDRRAALCRLLDHCLHTGYAADRQLDPFRDPIDAPPLCPGATAVDVAGHEDAMQWFSTELPGLLAAVDRAAEAGFDAHAWRLAWALAYFLERRGHWLPWAAAQHTALAAARRLADRTGQAHAHRGLGRVHVHLGLPEAAYDHFRQAHDLFRETGDIAGHARIHFDLCWISTRQGDPQRSLDHARQALELFQSTDNLSGQARAHNNVAWAYHTLGDHGRALASGERALALNRETGDRYGEADSWDTLGQAHLALHHAEASIRCCRRAVALYRELGHRWGEADTLLRLGEAYDASGARPAAERAWQHAVSILDDLGHPDADLVRAKLDRHGGRGATKLDER